jgi:hypothetical protein
MPSQSGISSEGTSLIERLSNIGMLAPRHKDALENIKSLFTESNYNLSFLLFHQDLSSPNVP